MRLIFVALLLLISLINLPVRAAAPKVKIIWLVGPGKGSNSFQETADHQIADEFNARHSDIELEVKVLDKCQNGPDCLVKLVSSGETPDIVGPASLEMPNSIKDLLPVLDLTPYFIKYHFALAGVEPALTELYRTPDNRYISIPFGVHPTVLYYNKAMFNEAGLNYPPAGFGQQYKMPNGTEVDWNLDTLTTIAKRLTLDSKGNDANSAAFDTNNIVQYGLNFQWIPITTILSDIQPANFYDATAKTVKIGPQSRAAARWLQNALWKYHIVPGSAAEYSDLLQPSGLGSGHVAMAIAPLWFTCCLREGDTGTKRDWDMAVIPKSLDGQYHNTVDAESFYILKATQHPDEAFVALSYMLNEAESKLAYIYGDYPSIPKNREGWVGYHNYGYPSDLNWSAASDSLQYAVPDLLNYQAYIPKYDDIQAHWSYFQMVLFSNTGATIDVDSELNRLQDDLQMVVNGE